MTTHHEIDINDPEAHSVVERYLAEQSLLDFIKQAWHVLEPATIFRPNFHIDAICDHLEAVSRGEIRRLLVNIPPRCMKSLAISVAWQVWEWVQTFWDDEGNEIILPGRGAHSRWLFASYAQVLSTRDTLKARRIIQSAWFQQRWGHLFNLAGDQNAKTRFENTKQGYRIATSVDSYATGDGGDIIVIDDPHNVHEAESELKREGAVIWLAESMSTRFNDQKTGRQVIVMQRVHERDCSGYVLSEELGYDHLCLPMRYEPSRLVEWRHDGSPNEDFTPPTSLGFVDPRSEEGELLWPSHLDQQVVDDLEHILGPYAVAGQLQQRPTPRGGGMFKRKDLRFVLDLPEVRMRWVRSWDLAGTDPEKQKNLTDPDWSVGVLIGATMEKDPDIYICDVERCREDPGERDAIMIQVGMEDKALVGVLPVWIEQEPGQSGKSQILHFRSLFAEIGLVVNPPRIEPMPNTPGAKKRIKETGTAQGNKVQRAEPLATRASRGKVYILQAEWTRVYVDELTKFPMAAHDDQVDATSQGDMRLMDNKMGTAQMMKLRGYFR